MQVTKSNFPTTATLKKVSPNDSNNKRQPEIAIWPSKPEILISMELWQIASKFQRQFWGFRPCLAEIKYCCRWNFDAIYHSFRYNNYFRFRRPYCHFRYRLSVADAIIWGHFHWTRHGWKRQNCCWNFDAIYHSSREISTSGLGGHIAISGCRSFSQSLSLNSPWSKIPGCRRKRTNLLFFYLNSWGLFYTQAQHVCVK